MGLGEYGKMSVIEAGVLVKTLMASGRGYRKNQVGNHQI